MKRITRRMRRMLFVVLCLSAAMAVSVVAASADSSETQTDTSVAKVGNLYYDSLAEAFDAVSGEGTVELVKDATVDVVVNVFENKEIILDMGWGCGRFLGQPMQLIQEIACTPQGSDTLTIS